MGAAGSVGSAVVRAVAEYRPSALHLVDLSENNLTEVVRELRSGDHDPPDDFAALPLCIGSTEFAKYLSATPPHDYILVFSALKHVRSEKDPYSLMRMYKTNVLYLKGILDHARTHGARRVFSVSSDKAVRPFNLMGATKTFMEKLLYACSAEVPFATARFANVAFSDGSLPHGFHNRLLKRQPIAGPSDVKRYFISEREAAELCLLACFAGGNREAVYPKLTDSLPLVSFADMARSFLEMEGLRALECASEVEAKEAARRLGPGSRDWPCYFAPSETTGEKPAEEFYYPDDVRDETRFEAVGVVTDSSAWHTGDVWGAMSTLAAIEQTGTWEKEGIANAIRLAVPELIHQERFRSLDQRM